MKFHTVLFGIMLVCMLAVPVISVSSSKQEEIIIERSTSSGKNEASKTASADGLTQTAEKSFKLYDKNTKAVFTISEKDYLIGTVLGEMYFEYSPEAYKAQTVAAYTNAVRYRQESNVKPDASIQGADFEVSTDGKSGFLTKEMAKERYGSNFEAAWEKASEAVEKVYGKIITYEDKPIFAAYHSISSGKTEDAVNVWNSKVSYLSPVDSPDDKNAEKYESTESFTADEVSRRLKENETDIVLGDKKEEWFKDAKKTSSLTVTEITAGNKVLSGQSVRSIFGLRSSCFDVSFKNDVFTFTVLGYGHNVGMSQSGADSMAKKGSKWEDILLHYYKDVKITTV